MKLLIDGDILVYRRAWACETRNNEIEPVENMYHLIKLTINTLQEKFETLNTKIYLTANDKSNFRFTRAKHAVYKGNRKDLKKPTYYEHARSYLQSYHGAEVISNYEADDALGIHQCEDPELDTIICSIDKDLHMIPGRHYNFVTDKEQTIEDPGTLTLKEGKISGTGYKWFYAQMLLGDRVDNIKGIKGYGPVKTYQLLDEYSDEISLAKTVWQVYQDNEFTLEHYLEIADLLWIWRKPNDCKSAVLRDIVEDQWILS